MDDLARAVAGVAREAAAMAFTRWRTDFARWEKSPGEPVCEVDLDVDAMLRARLGALLPDAGWLSEETADNDDRLDCARVWIVDPIDGTRDYIRGRAGWAVSIALVENGRAVIGVLDAPARDEVWIARAGGGATLNGRALTASTRDAIAGARVPIDALPKGVDDLCAVEKPNSIALRIAMVADDRADLLVSLRSGNEWDIAAAILIAHEAGARVGDALGGALAFNKPDPRSSGLIVSSPGIHDAARTRFEARVRQIFG